MADAQRRMYREISDNGVTSVRQIDGNRARVDNVQAMSSGGNRFCPL